MQASVVLEHRWFERRDNSHISLLIFELLLESFPLGLMKTLQDTRGCTWVLLCLYLTFTCFYLTKSLLPGSLELEFTIQWRKRDLGDLQDDRGVRRGDHLPPHKYIRNTSTCGTAPTEHPLNAGRRPQTSQKARNSPRTWVGQKKKETTETKE